MTKFIRSRIVHGVAVGLALFWPIALVLPRGVLFVLLNGTLAALFVGLLVAFWRATWLSLRDTRNPLGARLLLAGISVFSLGATGVYTWAWAYRYLGSPPELFQHPMQAFMSWIVLVGVALMLFSGMAGDRDEMRSMGMVVALILVLTLGVVYLVGGF